ncbi:hypothetical protein [Simkania negevensis]|uniref:Uncharacterized protein n=1 Tax=Simkania negevensis (strain ATCC VR-1471 / DSM 27360 / Z) TaxID=331113 RepID=F8L4K0_SIMNZ|nr:hypothetical protein [Simkania negevensis]CCB90255.1 hypothetical protein SNE_A23780 [Simkania negevensis Z]
MKDFYFILRELLLKPCQNTRDETRLHMILNFLKRIIFFYREKPPTKENREEMIHLGNGAQVGFSYSFSDALERSRKMREGTVSSQVLLPEEVNDSSNLDTPLDLRSYDYLRNFEENHSLGKRAFPLCVGPSEVELVKGAGALYCQEKKCWFWPYDATFDVIKMKSVLPRIHNPYCNHQVCKWGDCEVPPLLPKLVPEPLWGENLRKYLRKEQWDFLRGHTYKKSGYRCSICGGIGEDWPVECNEVWDYQPLEGSKYIAVLIDLKALCPRCHDATHLGKARVDGRYDEAIRHMAYINGWSLNHANRIADKAFLIFSELSEKTWLLGFDDACNWDPSVEKILRTFFSETAPALS